MLWLNRLRQRLCLTRHEALALLVLSVLLSVGQGVRYLQQRSVTVPVGAYDELDRLFSERSARLDSLPGEVPVRGVDRVPGTGPVGGAAPVSGAAPASRTTIDQDGRVDINAAGAAELETLPRIGPTTAARILDFRAKFGPFLDVDDLRQVRGIGEKTVELLRPLVVVASDSLPG
ncbi:MAG: ComEA family DNA-binding protein [Rhodothermales bacterium]